MEVFEREADFDPRIDPIVRVQAAKLRSKLTEYYSTEGRGDALVISIPKFPIINVPNRQTFTLKVTCTVIASNGLAALIYRFQTRLSRRIIARHACHLKE